MGQPDILVALDGSELAEAVLPYAEALARCTGSRLRLLQVLGESDLSSIGAASAWAAQHHDAALRRAETYLAQTQAAILARGLRVETLIRGGQAPEVIMRAADDHQAAMLVLTSHGQGGVKRWLLGTTAETVLCRSTRPVLFLHRLPAPEYEARALPRQIMVPLDGSPQAETALRAARDLAVSTGATLLLTGVVFADDSGSMQTLPEGEPYASAAEEEQAARGYLEHVAAELRAHARVEVVVLRGTVAEAMITFARSQHIDLILLSTSGHRAAPRTVLLPIVDSLARSGVPVLFIPPNGLHPASEPTSTVARPALDILQSLHETEPLQERTRNGAFAVAG
jgi:nucleotide-binding universal stress UspA family protein